jgi:ABC-type oligopeptide transport system substrate-binding subunit
MGADPGREEDAPMKKSRSILLSFIAATALALGLAGCAENSRTEPGTPAPFGDTPGEYVPQTPGVNPGPP